MTDKPPIVVLRSNDYSFLGILRSCHRAQIETISIIFDWPGAPAWLSEHSNAFQRHYQISNPYTAENNAVKELISIGQSLRSEYKVRLLIVPSSDTNVMLINRHYSVLSPYFLIMGSSSFDHDRLDVIHKDTCFERLSSQHIPCPTTIKCFDIQNIEYCVSNTVYPCIYKPAFKDYGQSFYRSHQGLKAVECATAGALRDHLTQEIHNGFKVVVQEKIEFDSVLDEIPAYLYVDELYRIRMFATGIKRTIHPAPFGTAIELELSHHPELFSLSSAVVKALKWRGILMIEFIRDLKDNQWKVIEVNTRPWLMSDFYSRCGLNYMSCCYHDLNRQDLNQQDLNQQPPEAVQPDPQLLDKHPLHIDLFQLIARSGFTLQALLDYLNQIKRGNSIGDHQTATYQDGDHQNNLISFTYFDKNDPTPGLLEATRIEQEFNIAYQEIVSIYEEFGSDL